jgi:hypothetical protein
VVKWLSEEVLGIKPTSPGFKTYQIVPHLGSSLTEVGGATPTPLGNIQASFNVSNGICEVSAPAGTRGIVGIPKLGKTLGCISINGRPAWDGAYHSVNGVGGAHEDAEFVYLTGVEPGSYSLKVDYHGSTPAYYEPLEKYAGQFVKQNLTTRGNWGGVYGKDGYVLCNYLGDGKDAKRLPTYVSSVEYHGPHQVVWSANVHDDRALAPNSGNLTLRTAACIYNADEGNVPTMDLTINTTGTRRYQVALYFVDWDRRGRELAVEMFDASTLNLVAPVQVVKDFVGGCYLVYNYDKSAKFRIDQVQGDNAVLSGIFFDSSPATVETNTP